MRAHLRHMLAFTGAAMARNARTCQPPQWVKQPKKSGQVDTSHGPNKRLYSFKARRTLALILIPNREHTNSTKAQIHGQSQTYDARARTLNQVSDPHLAGKGVSGQISKFTNSPEIVFAQLLSTHDRQTH